MSTSKHGSDGLPSSSPRNQRQVDAGAAPVEWINTGGSRRPKPATGMDWDWADEAYEHWRHNGDAEVDGIVENLRDAQRIDGSRGFSREEILLAKNNVMRHEHPIQDMETKKIKHRLFDSDPEIASAWIRLQKGEHIEYDTLLLEHEIAEARFWEQNPRATYSEAHKAATEVADWDKHRSKFPFNPDDYRS